MSKIKMYGPAFDNSGEIVETDVHPDNVAAFERSGWKIGELPKPAEDAETPGRVDAEGAAEKPDSTTPKRCAFIKGDGEQCGNDSVKDSDFCHIKSHKES